MNVKIFICLLLLSGMAQASKFATALLPLKDSSIHRFADINELYFLFQNENAELQKWVIKLSVCSNQECANQLIERMAKSRNPQAMVILSLDYFFKNKAPVAGSNVERVLNFLANSSAYEQINQYFFQQSIDIHLPKAQFVKAIQDTIGWRYGYGAFYYLSPQDSLYLRKMKKMNYRDIDERIIAIIEFYLGQQSSPFQYDVKAIVDEIRQLPQVVDVIHDDCLIKTDQLPNWDKIGVTIVKNKDTLERVYTIQLGRYQMFRLGKRISFPISRNLDILWYKGAEYGLHFVERTRKQCEENIRQHEKSMEEYKKMKQ
ncbi:MAG: hypothetical protein ACOYLG_09330 [Chitinophagaceae bacterium]